MLDGLSCGKGIKFVVWFQREEQETEEENPTQCKNFLLNRLSW